MFDILLQKSTLYGRGRVNNLSLEETGGGGESTRRCSVFCACTKGKVECSSVTKIDSGCSSDALPPG